MATWVVTGASRGIGLEMCRQLTIQTPLERYILDRADDPPRRAVDDDDDDAMRAHRTIRTDDPVLEKLTAKLARQHRRQGLLRLLPVLRHGASDHILSRRSDFAGRQSEQAKHVLRPPQLTGVGRPLPRPQAPDLLSLVDRVAMLLGMNPDAPSVADNHCAVQYPAHSRRSDLARIGRIAAGAAMICGVEGPVIPRSTR